MAVRGPALVLVVVITGCACESSEGALATSIAPEPSEPARAQTEPETQTESLPPARAPIDPAVVAAAVDPPPGEPLRSRTTANRPSRGSDAVAVPIESRVTGRSSGGRGGLEIARRGDELVLRVLGDRSSCSSGADFGRAWIGRHAIHVERTTHQHDDRPPSRCLHYTDHEITLPLPPAGTYALDIPGVAPRDVTVPSARGDDSIVVAENRAADVRCTAREPLARAHASPGGIVHIEVCGHPLRIGDRAHARIDNAWIVVESGGRAETRHTGHYVKLEGVPRGRYPIRVLDGAAVLVTVPGA